ncbi:hypothetical protein Hanom_Chr08g00739941 [Helianthus anomalus]
MRKTQSESKCLSNTQKTYSLIGSKSKSLTNEKVDLFFFLLFYLKQVEWVKSHNLVKKNERVKYFKFDN